MQDQNAPGNDGKRRHKLSFEDHLCNVLTFAGLSAVIAWGALNIFKEATVSPKQRPEETEIAPKEAAPPTEKLAENNISIAPNLKRSAPEPPTPDNLEMPLTDSLFTDRLHDALPADTSTSGFQADTITASNGQHTTDSAATAVPDSIFTRDTIPEQVWQ